MALAERAVREGCPGNHEHPKEPGEKSPTERRLSQKIGGKRHKKTIFSFSTFAQDWRIQVYLEQKQSLIAQIGVLETGKGRERDTETLLPDALCLFTYCSAFSHHPLLWKK